VEKPIFKATRLPRMKGMISRSPPLIGQDHGPLGRGERHVKVALGELAPDFQGSHDPQGDLRDADEVFDIPSRFVGSDGVPGKVRKGRPRLPAEPRSPLGNEILVVIPSGIMRYAGDVFEHRFILSSFGS
jgi:hypothetical protein